MLSKYGRKSITAVVVLALLLIPIGYIANDVSADPFLTLPIRTFMDVRSPPDDAADMP